MLDLVPWNSRKEFLAAFERVEVRMSVERVHSILAPCPYQLNLLPRGNQTPLRPTPPCQLLPRLRLRLPGYEALFWSTWWDLVSGRPRVFGAAGWAASKPQNGDLTVTVLACEWLERLRG